MLSVLEGYVKTFALLYAFFTKGKGILSQRATEDLFPHTSHFTDEPLQR